MSKTDPIADFLTLIRNASRAKKESVDVVQSRMNKEILEILKKEGYIADFKPLEGSRKIKVYLKYVSNRSAIKNLRKVSRPGLRVYTNHDKLPNVLRGLGIAVISTSKGVLTNKEARELKVGGEVLCYIW
jgi:small subunit ribosomal protein S8